MTSAKVDAARKLLDAQTPPKDVAAAVGVSVATLYRHLPADSRVADYERGAATLYAEAAAPATGFHFPAKSS